MSLPFAIVAHRGVPGPAPENTGPAFQRAVELGADAIELDVRLTRDLVPVVYHYLYLDEITTGAGPIFDCTFEQLRAIRVKGTGAEAAAGYQIATLPGVLETFAGRIGLEIEIKGPEPEAAAIVAAALQAIRPLWDAVEVTSYEPALLRDVQERCPGLAADLLFPRPEPWMRLDAVAHLALHRARLAQARAVHLHPTQLTAEVVAMIRAGGIAVHAWDVNDAPALQTIADLEIPRICTDRFLPALRFRTQQMLASQRP